MVDIEAAVSVLGMVTQDAAVPRNIRKATEDAMKRLQMMEQSEKIRINAAISILDEVSNDPNIPYHTRTQIWQVAGLLESE